MSTGNSIISLSDMSEMYFKLEKKNYFSHKNSKRAIIYN